MRDIRLRRAGSDTPATRLTLPGFGMRVVWTPSAAEEEAAFELLVQLATRFPGQALPMDEGGDRDLLMSLLGLSVETRAILARHGRATARDTASGHLSFAQFATRLLNKELDPFITTWHGRLEQHEASRPPNVSAWEWERQWGGTDGRFHVEFRSEFEQLRTAMHRYVFVLGRAAGTNEYAAAVSSDIDDLETRSQRLFSATGRPLQNMPWRPWPSRERPRLHMTRWLSPKDLALSLFYSKTTSDDRDGQPVRNDFVDYSEERELWFDYAADMGDAFDPMMAVMWTAGRDELHVGSSRADVRKAATAEWRWPVPAEPEPDDDTPDGERAKLPRGRLLVLGGDEVYPYANRRTYDRQFRLPMRHALQPGGDPAPDLFAIPGNHDWYGGLKHWRKRLVLGESANSSGTFEGWNVKQRASWFATKLPHGWWMWGIDTYLDGSINSLQRQFFTVMSGHLRTGDQVIICLPRPAWRLRESKPEQLVVLDKFIGQLIDPTGAEARVFLSGDAHVFASYTRRPSRNGVLEHHVTSGGAGAFLHPTHNLASIVPQTTMPHTDGIEEEPFIDGVFWPPERDTHEVIAGGVFRQLWDRQSPGVLAVIAAIHVLYSWLAGIEIRARSERSGDWPSGARGVAELSKELGSVGWSLISNPSSMVSLLMLGVIVVIARFAARANTNETAIKRFARRAGTGHGFRHAAVFFGIAWLSHWVGRLAGLAPIDAWPDRWSGWMTTTIVGALGAASAGMVLLMRYVARINRHHRVHDNEAFSFRHLQDGKHFLRCHIDETGELTLRLLGLERVLSGWARAVRKKRSLPPGTDGNSYAEVGRVVWTRTIRREIAPFTFAHNENRWVAISTADLPTPENQRRADLLVEILVTELLRVGFNIVYGGDPHRRGLTERLVQASSGPLGYRVPRLKAYVLADNVVETSGDFADGFEQVRIRAEGSRAEQLARMRERSTQETVARIAIGGSPHPSAQNVSGVLDEIATSLAHGQPTYIVGGFGGAAKVVANGLSHSSRELNNGLSSVQNHELQYTDEIHRVIHLILTGLRNRPQRLLAPRPETGAATEREATTSPMAGTRNGSEVIDLDAASQRS